ncbi:MAG: YjbQ family protein [Candidatus Schekmanbacteria bacterium]|nr:MAG: YjbQ family protein [Candidatus Schekmanbacteria bacterium]
MVKKINVKTSAKVEFLDITDSVRRVVAESDVSNGICCVYVPHTTAAVTINENADPSVQKDIIKETNKIIPFSDGYSHLEGNSSAHIKASLFGASENIIIEDGELLLGTWQGIYFCEFDGPRHRKAYIKIIASPK